MGNINMIEVKQSSEHLISQYFKLEARYLTLVTIFLQRLVQIAWEIVHHNVEILFLPFIGEETISNL